MPIDSNTLIAAAASAFAQQSADLLAQQARQPMIVYVRRATGSGDIDHTFALDRPFRLVFIRCHFVGTTQRAAMTIELDAQAGAAYDAELYVIRTAGPGRDVYLRVTADEAAEPSPWTFQTGDALRLRWTNPDPGSITWGVEVGMALTG
ncbi:MAG: hypothetical protein J5J06_12250 [Phycisphaerae bacterium]|nr:hypothetical protein [Phycisphaerae bacterium]